MSDSPAFVIMLPNGGAWHLPREPVAGFQGIAMYAVRCQRDPIEGFAASYSALRRYDGQQQAGCVPCLRLPAQKPPPATCEHCERTVEARGLCGGHYQRWRAGISVPGPLASRKNSRRG